MKRFLAFFIALLACSDAVAGPRLRVNSATIYVDIAPVCNNAYDGSSSTPLGGGMGPICDLQLAMDYAAGNFDCEPPYNWSPYHYIGERTCVTIQLAPASCSAPYQIPRPVYLSGLGASGPIVVRGDPNNPLNYCIDAQAAGLQGFTAQQGGRVIIDGVAFIGAPNVTYVNALSLGQVAVRNTWFGPSTVLGQTAAPIGAAGGGQAEVVGTVHFWGSNFGAIMTAIEGSRIFLGPSAVFDLTNCFNTSNFIGLQHAELWTMGNPPGIVGAGAGCMNGLKFSVTQNSFMGIAQAPTNVPGSGYTLGSASWAFDNSNNWLTPNAAGP